MATVINKPIWLTNDEAAEYIGIEPNTLEKWRSRGMIGNDPEKKPPKSYKPGGKIGYKQSDLDAWLETKSTG